MASDPFEAGTREPAERDYVDSVLEQWAKQRPDLDVGPMGLTSRIFRLHQILQHRMQDVCSRFGLDRAQFNVLLALLAAGPPHRQSPTDLRRSLLLSPAAITNRLYRLEADGLIERIPDEQDRRSLLVALTPEGLRRIEGAVTAHIESERRLLASLDAEELDLVTASLRRLLMGHEDHAMRRRRRPAGRVEVPAAEHSQQPATGTIPAAMSGPNWWPDDRKGLERLQRRLARQVDETEEWQPGRADKLKVGAVFVSLPSRSDRASESPLAWAAAVVLHGNDLVATATAARRVDRAYRPGYLALSVGPIFEEVVRSLSPRPDVLLVNAAGRDHPRGAGLAIQLGAALGMPTVGITDRPIIAVSSEPWHKRGSWSPLYVGERVVGYCLRTLANANPITVHAAWRTSPELARDVVLETVQRTRIPEPMQHARQLARRFRSEASREQQGDATGKR
jgi:deoxyribonuclease V